VAGDASDVGVYHPYAQVCGNLGGSDSLHQVVGLLLSGKGDTSDGDGLCVDLEREGLRISWLEHMNPLRHGAKDGSERIGDGVMVAMGYKHMDSGRVQLLEAIEKVLLLASLSIG
jgi:hypothetical protein